jgi:hypothetical protein
MTNPAPLTRRSFLAAGTAAAVAAPAILRGADLTKEPVRLAHIGLGTRGWDLVRYTGAIPEAKVVALCDVYAPHLKRGLDACGNPDGGPTATTASCSPIPRSRPSSSPPRITGTKRWSSMPWRRKRRSIVKKA